MLAFIHNGNVISGFLPVRFYKVFPFLYKVIPTNSLLKVKYFIESETIIVRYSSTKVCEREISFSSVESRNIFVENMKSLLRVGDKHTTICKVGNEI